MFSSLLYVLHKIINCHILLPKEFPFLFYNIELVCSIYVNIVRLLYMSILLLYYSQINVMASGGTSRSDSPPVTKSQ